MNLQKKWTVYLIHHSHTDIGYTERQDKIIRYHCDFIKQAVDILNDIHAGRREGCQGFVWQCENYWQVKNFYDHASPAYIADFEKYVKSGEIGLSGNYLNMTELVSYDVLSSRIAQAKAYGNQLGVAVKSGMSADINGYAWGYGDALCENGVENLYIALPFTAGQGDSQTIDKTGCAVRPGIDQLPGTNQEFYLLQNGLVCQGENKTVRVAVKDTPLMVFGSLKAHPIELCNGDNTALNQSCAYSWVMNNFWETNFKVDLGGFYEFAYTVSVEPRQADEEALARCQADNEGVISFYR